MLRYCRVPGARRSPITTGYRRPPVIGGDVHNHLGTLHTSHNFLLQIKRNSSIRATATSKGFSRLVDSRVRCRFPEFGEVAPRLLPGKEWQHGAPRGERRLRAAPPRVHGYRVHVLRTLQQYSVLIELQEQIHRPGVTFIFTAYSYRYYE